MQNTLANNLKNKNKLGEQIKRLAKEFESNSRLSPGKIQKIQMQKLEHLAQFCKQQSPFFAQRLRESQLTPASLATPQGLKQYPLLTRRDLQSFAQDIYCKAPPKGHFPIAETRTSGSTGEPVVVKRSAANQIYLLALTFLEFRWHQRNASERLCRIRANVNEYTLRESWGHPVSLFYQTGPALSLPITENLETLVKWMQDFQPHSLLVYPSTLAGLTDYCETLGLGLPSLKDIRCIGETLSNEVRNHAKDYFQVKITDGYSSQEIGLMALQCPEGLYHVTTPNVILEVLNEQGQACEPGEIGRIIVTDLNNFVTPMIRYDIRDYAKVGLPCSCGRGWPTLERIMGRERNLIHMPDGGRHWPTVGFAQFREIAPVIQYQVIQHSVENIEVRLVTERPLLPQEELRLREHIQKSLGHPFQLVFEYFNGRLPLGKNGKFEEFMSLI